MINWRSGYAVTRNSRKYAPESGSSYSGCCLTVLLGTTTITAGSKTGQTSQDYRFRCCVFLLTTPVIIESLLDALQRFLHGLKAPFDILQAVDLLDFFLFDLHLTARNEVG